MSYCRWSNGQLYFIFHVNGHMNCISCPLEEPGDPVAHKSWYSPSNLEDGVAMYDEAIRHLEEHKDAGHQFPSSALERLKKERKDYSKVDLRLPTLAQSSADWELKRNRLVHRSGYNIQRRPNHSKWSAWPPVKIPEDGEVEFPEDYSPMINKFDTPEEAMAWCEEQAKIKKPWT